jgi:hypothetical protein
MEITINYSSSWKNSFLDGSNNEALPKKGRNFVASMTSIKQGHFYERKVTHDTVMGLLSRLIGDQRPLRKARASDNYYFNDIEDKVMFTNRVDVESNEIVFIKNTKGSIDQSSFSGMLKSNDPLFSSDFSDELWSILNCTQDELYDFIINGNLKVSSDFDPMRVKCLYESEISKLKPQPNEGILNEAMEVLLKEFPSEKYPNNDQYLNKNGSVNIRSIYCSALYLQLNKLSEKYDLSQSLTKGGLIPGIAKRSITVKDFMKRFTTGKGKRIFGNPYINKEFGKEPTMLSKHDGSLIIHIDVDRDKGNEINEMIHNAKVGTFYVGKKGLAYLERVRV